VDSNLYLVTAPATEPVSLDEVRAQARAGVEEDTYLATLGKAAREWAEAFTARAFITQTWELKLHCFPDGAIELPKPPLVSVTSVTYLDTSNVEQTWHVSQYIVTGIAAETARGKIQPEWGIVYPSTLRVPDAVRVVFVAGYGAASLVPQGIKNALLLHAAEAFQNRERPDFSLAENTIWPWVQTRFD